MFARMPKIFSRKIHSQSHPRRRFHVFFWVGGGTGGECWKGGLEDTELAQVLNMLESGGAEGGESWDRLKKVGI